VIVVENLTKSYGSKKAVDSLSFSVAPGRVTGFLGPNGSGKSTTMRCMLGLDRPDTGHVLFDGKMYTEFERPLTQVGSLLDAGDAHKGRTARNHLRWIALTHGISVQRVDQVLQMVGMTEAANTRVGKFSLGMRQRLGLAAALLGDPQVVILDEPANGLDPRARIELRQMVLGLAAEGTSLLISSHILSELGEMCDSLGIIERGCMIVSGTVQEIQNRLMPHTNLKMKVIEQQHKLMEWLSVQDGVDAVAVDGTMVRCQILGAKSDRDQAALLRAMVNEGFEVIEFSTEGQTLEDVFMRITTGAVQ